MAFTESGSDEALFDVSGNAPHDEADSHLDDALRVSPDGPPPYLSPSSSSTFRSCARRWKFRYVDRLPDPPGEAAIAGTFAHRVLELLMELPGAQRSIDAAREIARETWPETAQDDDFLALDLEETEQRRFRWLAWTAIEGLWHLEDPSSVHVVANEQKVDTEIAGVPFRGIVDRLERSEPRSDSALVVSDYKSGRAPSQRFQADKLDQVLLYAAAIEASTGERPARARLLYLGQRIIEVEVTPESLSASTEGLASTWESLNDAVSTKTFEPSPGPLCGWCPYAGECPEGLEELALRHQSGQIRSSAPSLRFLVAV